MSCRLRLPVLTATVAACLLLPTEGRAAVLAKRHSVPREHPRLLGSRARLQRLAKEHPEAYQRTVRVAREQKADDHAKMISMALVSAIEGDADLGRRAVEMALTYARGPIKKGHTPFGHDLARCALVYDLCHAQWTDAERGAFHDYVNRTVDANAGSETHVFHNGWYGYKWWGIGLACYATYYENPRAKEILAALEREHQERAAPALELAGAGGGWAEGYYVHYWLYEWLFFCEVARFCEGAGPGLLPASGCGEHVRDVPGPGHLRVAPPRPDGRRRRAYLRRRPRQATLGPADPRQPFPRRPGPPSRPCVQRDHAAIERRRLRL